MNREEVVVTRSGIIKGRSMMQPLPSQTSQNGN